MLSICRRLGSDRFSAFARCREHRFEDRNDGCKRIALLVLESQYVGDSLWLGFAVRRLLHQPRLAFRLDRHSARLALLYGRAAVTLTGL